MTKLTIYIVEDEPILAKLLHYTLKSMGHDVCGIADSYSGAIADLDKLTPDLVITDIMLNGPQTGIDIARYMRENYKVPFMFLSSIADPDMIQDALSTNPITFLKKPVSKEALHNAINIFNMMNAID